MEQKTFYQALLSFHLDPIKTKQVLSDKRPTLIEKKIIESCLLIRNNQNQEAFDLLNQSNPSEFSFVEGMRQFQIGIAQNNLSQFSAAEISLKRCLEILEPFDFLYFKFQAHFNLFVIYSNRHRLDEMKFQLEKMQSYPIEQEVQNIRLLRCEFDYYSENGDSELALSVLEKIGPLKLSMSESDVIAHLICEFMFFVKVDNFSKCQEILSQMKKYRKFNLTENYNFMKKMLENLTLHKPIYAYQSDFENIPVLYFQLKVIQSLEEKDQANANSAWSKLKEIDHKMYGDNFQYQGNKCLFSLCLAKFSYQEASVDLVFTPQSSKLDTLITILEESVAPMNKGQLYELLWGEHPVDKDDIKKLTRLISKAKSERGVDIKSHKGTYAVVKKPQVKTA